MKKAMTVLLMGLMGLFGTLAWAGSAREDTVEHLQREQRWHQHREVQQQARAGSQQHELPQWGNK